MKQLQTDSRMSQYRFSLHNYHAISSADIAVNGITVIAGPNGCGKSTIARWLYAYIKYSNQFGELIDDELSDKINELIGDMRRALRGLGPMKRQMELQFRSISQYTLPRGKDLFGNDGLDYKAVKDWVSDKIDLFCSYLEQHLDEGSQVDVSGWIQKSLFEYPDLSEDFINDFKDNSLRRVNHMFDKAEKAKREQPKRKLFEFIKHQLNVSGEIPESMNLNENGLDLINQGHFVTPFKLRNVVYVDTPVALSNFITIDNNIWDDFQGAMTEQLQPMPASAKKIALRIKLIIGGDVVLNKDELSRNTELRYRRKADSLDIPVGEVATGMKTFAYMLRLLENGYLTENSILIIDEPEAHLHPQWIVEFARILVLLNKEVGTKIMLASHNPDLVAAIRSIAAAEDMSDTTCFYQAERDNDSFQYSYRNLGNDITEIFHSFNIALERIKDYGE